ncbi:MAG: ExeM/NucH family extracellular endonuclease [Gaiellaceae bacterium]
MKLAVVSARLALGVAAIVVLLAGALSATANTSGTGVVISQVYGGGGNFGSTYTNDFIELYNPTPSAVPLTGWSVQYAATTGTNWQKTELAGTIPAGGYYLVQEAQGAGGTTPLPTPNATGTIPMAAGAGKVVLLDTNTLTTAGTSCPASRVDLVGYGTGTNCFEGVAPAPTINAGTSDLRANNGATDTDSNGNDFAAGAPNPRNSVTVPSLSIDDVSLNEGNSGTTSFTFTVSLSAPAGAGGVTFDIATADNSAASPSDYTSKALTAQSIPMSSSTYSFTVLVNGDTTTEPAESFFVNVANVTGATVADSQGRGTILDDDVDVCAQPYAPIYTIQGSGPSAAVTGAVATEGVVVGDYEGPSPALRGFYLQDATGDGDAATSDGIFVFNNNNNSVSVGDVVRVTGTATEFQEQTQISLAPTPTISECGTASVAPTDVTLPFASATFPERYEGMLVRMHQTLYVTEHFQLGRFGEVLMSSGGRLHQPTNVMAPGAPAAALQAENDRNQILVDDALQNQNPDPIVFGRFGNSLTASNTLRGGDTATDVVGVMTYTWAGNAASGNAFRVRPIGALGGGVPSFQPSNPRPAAAPSVGGSVRVVGMNLLNFFNTFSGCANGVGGASTDCRGADSQAEFDRQWPKTVAAILAMNPDVLGVNELENDGYGSASAIRFLVDRLNDATAPGTYAFIDADAATGQVNALGTDAIKVSMLYKPASVTPVGQTAVLNSVAFVNGGDSFPRSRPSLAQAFQVNATGARFIVDDNHLKSKGSACDQPDAGDGQGNCNQERANAATELTNWLASNPTGTGDPDILLVGDYNSYAMEDPITVIRNAGFTNLVSTFDGPHAYSYVFDGQWGYLDHALGSASLVPQVTGVGDFHINSDEPSVLDYNTDFKTANLISTLYAPDEFRVSDHDPVVIGLDPPLTFDSLCSLTRTLVSTSDVADGLCDKLAAAAAADAAGKTKTRDNVLSSYRFQLSAQAGRSLSKADAERLASLSLQLP